MKHIITLLLLSLPCCLLAQSKRKIQKEMNSWMGHSKHELIMGYGPPSRTCSDGSDGEIVIFSRMITHDNPSLVPTSTGGLQIQQNMPYVVYKHRMFYINRENIIYYWNYESNTVPPERLIIQVDANIYQR